MLNSLYLCEKYMELKKETIIKIFAGISVIAIGLAIFFYLNKEEYLFWLSVIANVIQVILFLFWFFESSRSINEGRVSSK